MIVFSNSSPLIGLAKAGRLSLLKRMYQNVLIPALVYQDVVVQGRGRPGARAVQNAIRQGWLKVVSLRERSLIPNRLSGTGEGEAIALSLQCSANLLIVDDQVARRESDRLKLPWITTVGVIRDAKGRGVLRRARPLLDRMIARGFGIADYPDILLALGES